MISEIERKNTIVIRTKFIKAIDNYYCNCALHYIFKELFYIG